jgi:hypothetical protein
MPRAPRKNARIDAFVLDALRLNPAHDTSVLEACPYCGEEVWLDLVGNAVDWRPCCPDAQYAVETEGFEGFYGMSVKDALHEWLGVPQDELREVFGAGIPSEEDPDSYYEDTTYARFPLREDVPMKLQKKGKRGKPAFAGPKGWQESVFKDVELHHSHHRAPQGWKFGVAVNNGLQRVGVAVVSNPVSRVLMQKEPDTLEVTRVCVFGHPKLRRNAVSKLYSLCAKEAKKLGASKLITYTLESEDGRSLLASGWTPVARSEGGDWSREGRARTGRGKVAEYSGPKIRWEKILDPRRAKPSPAIELPARGESHARGEPPEQSTPAEVEAVAASVNVMAETSTSPSWLRSEYAFLDEDFDRAMRKP